MLKQGAGERPTVSRTLLRAMTEAIVAATDPERIVLFGSHAGGQATRDSDVDLLVVKDYSSGGGRLGEVQQVRRALQAFPVSKDILVYSPEEFEKWRQTTNHVVARAAREGVLLYERTQRKPSTKDSSCLNSL